MVDAIFVIMVFHVLISEVILTENPRNGTCGTSEDRFKCCTDYKRNGSRCVPCIGSFGPGCTKICPPGYYGFGCKTKCECEQCDKLNGSCVANNTTQMQSNGKGSSGSWLPVIFGVVISTGSMAGQMYDSQWNHKQLKTSTKMNCPMMSSENHE
ncbi:N-acetylglucosamine-1-phosphodiester alpha-N-acetylglucosaminidase-like isoform X2 [Ostrea edulis]|uniref:N-acetylglucosamine-1-phosphodiester alpha-N-acetylglucosaminidase-like isoform X2 n=1 Tax=Ostrea edulis TaxID=37623 RepID=UPI0024AEA779|nr:N-acetylglucosamine-1-phosphodiester alpha-N-acetylglucosaminidase-like isoform X2 [Ostrea edulis]